MRASCRGNPKEGKRAIGAERKVAKEKKNEGGEDIYLEERKSISDGSNSKNKVAYFWHTQEMLAVGTQCVI